MVVADCGTVSSRVERHSDSMQSFQPSCAVTSWVCRLAAVGAVLTSVAPALGQFGPGQAEAMRPEPAPVDRDTLGSRQEARVSRDWMLSLEGVTNAPVDVGVRVTAQAPFGARLSSGFGIIPGAYLSLINNAVAGTGAYDDRTAGIVDGSFDGGTSWRTQIGFRPFPRVGLYIDAGYALVNLSGNVYGSDVAPDESVDLVIDGTSVRDAGYRVDTTLHLWLVELGWQGRIFDKVVLGMALGVMGTLSASTSAEPNFSQGSSLPVRTLSRHYTSEVDAVLEKYGYIPTLTLRVGYDVL